MKIYFVRHGETEYNRKSIHQSPDVPLSKKGVAQIEKTAKALKALGATKLITSDLLRAYQSAEIIGEELGLAPELHSAFREVRRPSELFGEKYFSFASAKVAFPILAHLHNRNWHYSDEENLYDLKDRVARAVAQLEAIGKEHEKVVVVSHAFILQIFLRYMCKYKDVRIIDYVKTLIAAKSLGNGSITTVAYNDDGNGNTCDWLCIRRNDRSHLA